MKRFLAFWLFLLAASGSGGDDNFYYRYGGGPDGRCLSGRSCEAHQSEHGRRASDVDQAAKVSIRSSLCRPAGTRS